MDRKRSRPNRPLIRKVCPLPSKNQPPSKQQCFFVVETPRIAPVSRSAFGPTGGPTSGLFSNSASAPSPAAPPSPAPKQIPPKKRRLHVASAEASSYLVNDWNKFQENYLPLYVSDDDPKTAWSLKTEGIGEWLRVHVTPMQGASKLRMKIRNGYQKTPRL